METLTKYIEKTKIKIEIKEDIKSKIKELQDSIKYDDEEEQIKARIYDMIKLFPEYEVELHSKDADIVVKDKGTKQIVAFFECKSVKNKNEVIEENHINKKALHELIYYFLKAYKLNRDDIPTYLVVTNGKKWFVFNNAPFRDFAMDEKTLERLGISDRMLFKESSTSEIYEKIKNYLGAHKEVLKNFKDNCFYFSNPEDIYRFLSPDILLNKYNPSTGRALNKEFYDELLYIFGLKEVELNGKKKIVPNGVPNTFYSQISEKVNDEEKILDLIIIWLNRILFLKLFEAKLVEFNDNKTFTFMDKAHIPNTTALKSLFFDVLAVPENQRGSKAAKFEHVPYLNSSLFEEKEIEKEFPISDIQGDDKIPYYSNTVLHTYKGKKFIRKQGETKLLDYLFEFLSAYRFEGKGDPSSLISPAVLGLVFEKINGYKDGSYYTPTEITDFMAKTAIEKAILSKVKEQLRLDYNKFEEFKTAFFTFSEEDRKKIREIIRNLTILDPAVGSGHFLVSSLNVLLEIWYELGMIDIPKKYEVKFENGDIKLYKNDKPFVYRKNSSADDADFQQKVFKAKKEIIENNLFGVDINPKAVEIARLRLWIELLKNAYYKPDGTMETLPNIDINIKVGDSLLAPIVDISTTLFNKRIPELKELFITYQNTSDKAQRKEIVEKFGNIRKEIITGIETSYNDLIWTLDFPQILDNEGRFVGFDIVIANPPYISAVTMPRNNSQKEYFKKMYPLATGAYDIYILFLLKSMELLNKIGVYTFIIPNKFLIANYAKKCKEFLIKENGLINSIDVSNFKVFKDAGVYPIIIVGRKGYQGEYKELSIDEYEDLGLRLFKETKKIRQYKTFREFGIKLYSGTTGFQASQIIPFIKIKQTNNSIPFITSGNVDRYYWSNKNVRYMGNFYSTAFIEKNNFIADSKWQFWNNPKIIIAGMTKMIEAVYSSEPVALGVGIYGIYDFAGFEPKCLNGLLNSKFMTFYLRQKFKNKHLAGGYLGINKSTIEELPLVDIDKTIQKKISVLVDQIIAIKKNNPDADVSSLEKQIDDLVYKLYGLTDEEIKIIENEINEI